jgi:putative endonuclease
MASFYTYILYSQKTDRYYVGSTQDLVARLNRHNSGATKSTKSGRPWELVYFEEYSTRAEAYNREQSIKKQKSRVYIESLLAGI